MYEKRHVFRKEFLNRSNSICDWAVAILRLHLVRFLHNFFKSTLRLSCLFCSLNSNIRTFGFYGSIGPRFWRDVLKFPTVQRGGVTAVVLANIYIGYKPTFVW